MPTATSAAALQATRDILDAIHQHRGDEKPIFDIILENACRLCRAPTAWLTLIDDGGEHLIIPAWRGASDTFAAGLGNFREPIEGSPLSAARAMVEQKVIRIDDIIDTDLYREGEPNRVRMADVEGIRSIATVPMIRNGAGIGSILLYRREVDPFTDDDIALIETFASQAVIAIENVRQFREVQERLERETATKDILRVISQSRDDEAPVFDAILNSATRLCDADSGSLMLINDHRTHTVLKAVAGKQWGFEVDVNQWPLDLGHAQTEAARTGEVVHEVDLKDSDIYRKGDETRVRLVDEIGLRTALAVPLLQGDTPLGVIVLHRLDVARAFSENDIKLIESFAAQAVIAIENVRQFREVQERLEREAASGEVLSVISTSRDDEVPVFETILESASRLCKAPIAFLSLANEDRSQVVIPAHRGTRSEFGDILEGFVEPITRTELVAVRPIATGEVVLEDDIKDHETYRDGDPRRRQMVDVEGARSVLAVPLLQSGAPIGAIVLYRREVAPFSQDDLSLVQSFAAQAVIAIENVRQFREVQERLEREQGSNRILQTISTSRDDEQPVLDQIVQAGIRMVSADRVVVLIRQEQKLLALAGATIHGLRERGASADVPFDPDTNFPSMAMATGEFLHLPVATGEDLPKFERALYERLGVKSSLYMPLMSGSECIGVLVFLRFSQQAFSDDEITVSRTFSNQAVIAIENVRQFREVQERLEREAATKKVLAVISQSRDDEYPVFDAILEQAASLCDAPLAQLHLKDNRRNEFTMAASWGEPLRSYGIGDTFPILPEHAIGQSLLTSETIHIPDLKEDDVYRNGEPYRVRLVDEEGLRSILVVPLVQDGACLGCIVLSRRVAKAFKEADHTLVSAFAAQAVIAIENVRQFKALETLNAELGDRVQDQVGEIERMGRLKRFLPAAVADAVVTSGDESMLTSHRAMVATLFCDMRGFTAFCEAAEPEETIEVLQTYHQEMSDLIDEYGGGVDQRAGDGIMVIFNDPIPVDDPAGDAVRLAVAMREKMKELCANWKRLGHRLGFGVGVSLGYATVGMVGSAGRFDYTASGTSVNTAARLCDMAADGEILISPRVWVAVEGDFQAESRGEVEMKGIREPVEVFAVD